MRSGPAGDPQQHHCSAAQARGDGCVAISGEWLSMITCWGMSETIANEASKNNHAVATAQRWEWLLIDHSWFFCNLPIEGIIRYASARHRRCDSSSTYDMVVLRAIIIFGIRIARPMSRRYMVSWGKNRNGLRFSENKLGVSPMHPMSITDRNTKWSSPLVAREGYCPSNAPWFSDVTKFFELPGVLTQLVLAAMHVADCSNEPVCAPGSHNKTV